jgi:hypothetical protein
MDDDTKNGPGPPRKRKGERDAHSVMCETWLDQVLADKDRKITGVVFRAAWAVSLYFNRATRVAFAGTATYATRAHLDRRDMQHSIAQLVANGHLSMVKGGGRHRVHELRPIFKSRSDAIVGSVENSGDGPALSDVANSGNVTAVSGVENSGAAPAVSEETAPPFKTEKGRSNAVGNSGELPSETAVTSPPYHLVEEEPLIGPLKKKEKEEDSLGSIDESFEQFYAAYPRHTARADAARAYRKIVKAGDATPDELLEGARRFAAERRGQDSKYTAHAATWLNGHRWTDEPSQPQQGDPTDRPRSGAASAAWGVGEYLKNRQERDR